MAAKKGLHPPKPMKSKAQWRMFFARGRTDPKWAKWAHDKANATPPAPKARYDRLPGHVPARRRT